MSNQLQRTQNTHTQFAFPQLYGGTLKSKPIGHDHDKTVGPVFKQHLNGTHTRKRGINSGATGSEFCCKKNKQLLLILCCDSRTAYEMVYSASTANNEPPLQSAADFLYALTFPATAETFSTTSASVATNVSTAPVAAAAAAAAGVAPALIGLPLFFRDAQRTARYAEISDYMLLWGIIDIALVIWICSGNAFTILAIACSRRLRTITSNWFVLALAMSDLLVGITLPYHLAFYMGSGLGAQHGWCLLRFFLIIIACCVSICNLIAIAVDRYVAIVYPLHYVRFVTRRVAVAVMCSGWLAGCLLGGMPMVWNNWATAAECEFDEVLPQWYVVGVMTPLFTAVWVCMLVLYVRIWAVASQQARKIARSSICALTERRPAGGDRKSVQVREKERGKDLRKPQ